MRGDAIPCRFCGFLQMPYLAFNKSRTRWRLALPSMTRHHWTTYLIAPPPSAENPWTWIGSPFGREGWEEMHFTSVRSYLAHVRKHNPAFLFKSVRHPPTGMGSAEIQIKTRLRPAHIRKMQTLGWEAKQ